MMKVNKHYIYAAQVTYFKLYIEKKNLQVYCHSTKCVGYFIILLNAKGRILFKENSSFKPEKNKDILESSSDLPGQRQLHLAQKYIEVTGIHFCMEIHHFC